MTGQDHLQADFLRRWIPVQDGVAAFILAALGDRSAADDVLQETALALMQAHGRYDPARPFIGWAVGIARNRVQQHQRERARKQGGWIGDEALDALAAAAADPDGAAERAAELSALSACLQALRGRSAELMRLHHGLGLGPAGIAERLRLRDGHVRVLLHRVRAALRTCVERRLAAAP